jgi:hypothetical protein
MPTKTKAPVMEAPVIEDEQLEPQEVAPEFAELMDEGEDAFTDEPETDEEDGTAAMLTGAELLELHAAKTAEGMALKDIAYQAGYFGITKDGKTRISLNAFKDALLEANGISVAKKKSVMGRGRGSAGLTRARVSGAGVLLVSNMAVAHVGAEVGSIFQVSFPGEGQILLTATGEIVPVSPRGKASEEEPGTSLLDGQEEGAE